MGCDIHLIMEYKPLPNHPWIGIKMTREGWRDYGFFARIAGVRDYSEMENALEPKGIPENSSDVVKNYTTYVIRDNIEGWHDEDFEPYICEETGRNAVGRDVADINSRYTSVVYDDTIGEQVFVHPDLHSHTWLTTEELKEALEDLDMLEDEEEILGIYLSYTQIYRFMEKLNSAYHDVRLFACFDN